MRNVDRRMSRLSGDASFASASTRLHAAVGAEARPRFGIAEVRIHGFRSAREVTFAPGALCAMVGEASVGKSNLLAAILAVLDPAHAPVTASDAVAGEGAPSICLRLTDGREVVVEGAASTDAPARPEGAPAVLFLPAQARAGSLIAAATAETGEAARAAEIFVRARGQAGSSTTASALAGVAALESCCLADVHGLVLLIEEPELYLRPQLQRYLYRLLRRFSARGNQVIYSTHSPAFLNVARLDEIVFVERLPEVGTRAMQPAPIRPEEDFRVLTEFDAARSELFLARAVILVEGATEKQALPFVFAALGHDADREAISIVECGGKANIPLFARICTAIGVPFLAVYDSDLRPGRAPVASDEALNALLADVVGEERRVVLEPDFETASGLAGNRNKPKRAWRHFADLSPDEVPPPLERAVALAVLLARG